MNHESSSHTSKMEKITSAVPNTYGSAPEEWKVFFRTFEALRKEVFTKIFALDQEEQDKFLKRMWAKQDQSFSSVDEPRKYLACHKSIGSSTGPITAPYLDFEGEHSLLKFFEELNKELS